MAIKTSKVSKTSAAKVSDSPAAKAAARVAAAINKEPVKTHIAKATLMMEHGKVPVDSIRVLWASNPRMPKGMKEAAAYEALVGQQSKNIRALKANIAVHGLLQAIIVVPFSDPKNPEVKWDLKGGFRRMASIVSLKTKEVLVRVISGEDSATMQQIGVSENSEGSRVNVNPIVMAERVAQIVAEAEGRGLDEKEIAARCGYEVGQVQTLKMLHTAPEHVKHLVRELGWSVAAVNMLKTLEDGEDDAGIIWDTKELVAAIVAELGKNGKPSANEVATLRAKILKRADDEARKASEEEVSEDEGEEAGSELDESENVLMSPEFTKKQAAEYLLRLGNLFIFAGDELEDMSVEPALLMMSPKADPAQRKAFLAGAIYGINRARLGGVEDVLDTEVDEKRRKFSAVKRLQRVILDAAYAQHPVSSHADTTADDFNEVAYHFVLSLSDSTKGTLTEKMAALRARCDKKLVEVSKRAAAPMKTIVKEEEVLPTLKKSPKAKADEKPTKKTAAKK